MSSTNKTTNIELSQYIATDKPTYLVDYNGDMLKIDNAIGADRESIATAQSTANTADGKADANATAIQSLDTELNDPTTGIAAGLTDVTGDVNTIQSLIGNGEPTTTDKTIIGAINEVNAALGDEGATVTALNAKMGLGTSFYQFFKNKKVLILGDSNSIEGEGWRGRTWVTDFKEMLSTTGATITNNSVSGRSIAKYSGYVDSLVDTVDNLSVGDWDYVIISVGINDWSNQSDIGSLDVSSSFDYTKFDEALTYCVNTLAGKAPNAGLFIVTPLNCKVATKTIPLLVYANALKGVAGRGIANGHDITIIDGFCAPNYIINGSNETPYSMDGLHPNAAYAPILARYIAESMMNGGSPICKASITKNLILNSDILDTSLSWARYTVFSDGSVEIFLDVTIASGATYAPFITGGIPDYILSSINLAIWVATIAGTNVHEVDYLDSANNSPYPSASYLDAGTKYKTKVLLKPSSMNITIFE